MPAPDLTLSSNTCDAVLHRQASKLDGADNAYQYQIDLCYPITCRVAAEGLEDMVPGLANAYDQAIEEGDNWRASSTVKLDLDLRVVLFAKQSPPGQSQGPVDAGGVIVQGSGRVQQVKAELSKKVQRLIIRLLLGNQSYGVASALLANLQRTVTFSYDRPQQALNFHGAVRPAIMPGMVAVLSGEPGLVGRVVEVIGETVTLKEEGKDHTAHTSEVVSAFSFSDDPSTESALDDYADRCRRRGYAPSWGVLVDVMSADEDGTRAVTLEHVEAAVKELDVLNGGAQPPEGATFVEEPERTEQTDAPTGPAESVEDATDATPSDEPNQSAEEPSEPNKVLAFPDPSEKATKRRPRGKSIAASA